MRVENTYNLESIAATDFNFGVKILKSSCYTHKKFRATPTSGLCLTMAVHRWVPEAYSSF